MALQKRKAVAKSAGQLFKRPASAASSKGKVEEEQHEEEEAPEVEENEAEHEVEEAEGGEEEAEEQESEEDALKRREEEITAVRKKELKAMPVGELKDLATGKGLEAGKKEDMVTALLAHEAEVRAAQRAHQAKIREVLVKKKEELEGLSAPELKDLCVAAGTKGMMTKTARVELLLKQWQDDDGVDKAIARMAREAREAELAAMDKAALQKLCTKSGVECFVKEVVVERVVKCEGAQGRFARPRPEEDEDEEAAPPAAKSGKKAGDMVEALLENEAKRKRERDQKKQEEDAAASKRKEFKAMSLEELKKLLTSKGQEPTGKKDDLVEAAFAISAQEDAAAARKAKLKSMDMEKLKQRLASKGLPTGKKEAMVQTLLAHEAKLLEAAKAWEFKVGNVLEKKRAELEEKTGSELKELCGARSLKLGVGKQERVETLLEDAQANGEVNQVIAAMNRDARRGELLGMDKATVLEIGEAAGVDLLVKEVMVERLLLHEDEFGAAGGGEEEEEDKKRPAKRARAGKK